MDGETDMILPFCKIGKNINAILKKNVKTCTYANISQLAILKIPCNDLFIFHVNIRSIQKNFDGLYELISFMDRPPDILCMTEIRIKNTPTINIDFYNFVHVNSLTNAGGVAFYISNKINYTIENEFNIDCEGSENLWTTINTANFKLPIGVVYRQPKSNINLYLRVF